MQVIPLKNTGRFPTVFLCDTSALPAGVCVAPLSASLEPGATCSISITVECTVATAVSQDVTIEWRGRAANVKKVVLSVTANVCVPDVKLMESRIPFGGNCKNHFMRFGFRAHLSHVNLSAQLQRALTVLISRRYNLGLHSNTVSGAQELSGHFSDAANGSHGSSRV